MKRILYIGQYTEGSTSRMRANVIQDILGSCYWSSIDTNIPFYRTSKVFRSIGFRFYIGPLIWRINRHIKDNLKYDYYDLIWIDKGVYLNNKCVELLRKSTAKLVHYTPDMAFYSNRSIKFLSSLKHYDKVITTKSTELKKYTKYISKEKLILTTQGYKKDLHKSYHRFDEKDKSVVFIGLGELSRFEVISFLINNGISVKLVGKGWNQFVYKYRDNENLNYLGEGIFGKEYGELISSSLFALGLLSKNFPEKHTTRTFEIPACGTALLTERNAEIETFYTENEVIYFDSLSDLLCKLNFYASKSEELRSLISKAGNKVNPRFSYEEILKKILTEIGF